MDWHNIDWSAVIAALIALYNAFQHRSLRTQVAANHAETLAAVAVAPAAR